MYVLMRTNDECTFRVGNSPATKVGGALLKRMRTATELRTSLFERYLQAKEAYQQGSRQIAEEKLAFLEEANQSGMDPKDIERRMEAYNTRLLSLNQRVMDAYQAYRRAGRQTIEVWGQTAEKLGMESVELPPEEETAEEKRTGGSSSSRRRTPAKKAEQNAPLWEDNPSMTNTIKRRRDKISLSDNGKLAKLIEQLKAQKEAIIEQKEALVERAVDSGVDMEDLQDTLASFDEKIETINERIQDLMAEQAKGQAEKMAGYADKQKVKKKKEPVTEEEHQQQKVAELTDMSARMDKQGVLHDAQNKIERQGKQRQGELKNDLLGVELRLSRRKVESAIARMGGEDGGMSTEELKAMLRERKQLNRQMRESVRQTYEAMEKVTRLGEQIAEEENPDEEPLLASPQPTNGNREE